MDQLETRQLAVVERAEPTRLIGILALSDIVRAQARAGPAFSEVQTTLTDQPAFRRLRPFVPDQPVAVTPEHELRYHTVILDPGAPAVGQPVRALALPPGVLLVTIERAHQTLAPQGGTVLAADDRITLFAPTQHLPSALAVLTGAPVRDADSPHA